MDTYNLISLTTHFFLFIVCMINEREGGSWYSGYALTFYIMWLVINGICMYGILQ
jgi:hypothetical protein